MDGWDVRLRVCQRVMDVLQKTTVQRWELDWALGRRKDVRLMLLQRDSRLRKAIDGDTEALIELERDGSGGELFKHTLDLVSELEEYMDRQEETTPEVESDEDANAEHKTWEDWKRTLFSKLFPAIFRGHERDSDSSSISMDQRYHFISVRPAPL